MIQYFPSMTLQESYSSSETNLPEIDEGNLDSIERADTGAEVRVNKIDPLTREVLESKLDFSGKIVAGIGAP